MSTLVERLREPYQQNQSRRVAAENAAADEIESLGQDKADLKEFCTWLTGCGYNFCQHEYFIQQRDKLLKEENGKNS